MSVYSRWIASTLSWSAYQFADEGQRVFGMGVRDATGPNLIAEGATDAVPVMAVGNQDIVGSDLLGDRSDAARVADTFHDVLDAINGHR